MENEKKIIKIYYDARLFRECAYRTLGKKNDDDSISIVSDTRILILGSPFFVNIAFSCELYIKNILLLNDSRIPKIHDLYVIFGKLKEEVKKRIIDRCGCEEQEFYRLLKECANLFKEYRYGFEKENLPNPNKKFILNFVDELDETCFDLMKNTNKISFELKEKFLFIKSETV